MNANPNGGVIQALRNQVQALIQECRQIRQELNDVNNENRNYIRATRDLRLRIRDLERDNGNLQNQNNNLNQEKEDLSDQLKFFKPKICQRHWTDVTRQTKRKRKSDYNEILDRAIKNIPECKKAKISLRLGEENVRFKWSIDNMRQHRESLRRQGFNIMEPRILSDDERSDIDALQTDEEKKKKRRKVVSMMDKFKISQKGYHEFRKMFAPTIPPINQIKQERLIMSGEIPYIKHHTVNLNF